MEENSKRFKHVEDLIAKKKAELEQLEKEKREEEEKAFGMLSSLEQRHQSRGRESQPPSDDVLKRASSIIKEAEQPKKKKYVLKKKAGSQKTEPKASFMQYGRQDGSSEYDGGKNAFTGKPGEGLATSLKTSRGYNPWEDTAGKKEEEAILNFNPLQRFKNSVSEPFQDPDYYSKLASLATMFKKASADDKQKFGEFKEKFLMKLIENQMANPMAAVSTEKLRLQNEADPLYTTVGISTKKNRRNYPVLQTRGKMDSDSDPDESKGTPRRLNPDLVEPKLRSFIRALNRAVETDGADVAALKEIMSHTNEYENFLKALRYRTVRDASTIDENGNIKIDLNAGPQRNSPDFSNTTMITTPEGKRKRVKRSEEMLNLKNAQEQEKRRSLIEEDTKEREESMTDEDFAASMESQAKNYAEQAQIEADEKNKALEGKKFWLGGKKGAPDTSYAVSRDRFGLNAVKSQGKRNLDRKNHIKNMFSELPQNVAFLDELRAMGLSKLDRPGIQQFFTLDKWDRPEFQSLGPVDKSRQIAKEYLESIARSRPSSAFDTSNIVSAVKGFGR